MSIERKLYVVDILISIPFAKLIKVLYTYKVKELYEVIRLNSLL